MLAMVIFGSCSDEFLKRTPKGSSLEAAYYKNRDEAYAGLVAVYDVVGWQGAGYVTKVGAMNAASDDHLAGGGTPTDVYELQVVSDYSLWTSNNGPQTELWKKGYSGIYRANLMLQKLPGVPMDETEKARFTAEIKLLRAYFYFDLVRMFQNIPLLTEPVGASDFYSITQTTPDAVYAQIEQDLQEAIPGLPAKITDNQKARVTAGIGHALLGKVYLYQEKWAAAAAEFKIVNGNTPGAVNPTYGYKLLSNFSDLWKTNNEFNTESIFEISFTNKSVGTWNCIPCTEGNVMNIMSGPRGYVIEPSGVGQVPEYVSGWSFYVVTPNLAAAMNGDPRAASTIADIGKLAAEGKIKYTKGYSDTGYFFEKYAAKQADRSTEPGNFELNFPQNMYEIRLADTYLMEAEALVEAGTDATRAQALLDAVRDRVDLPSVPATLENIYAERRLELAGEGHRWFDLNRTGRAAAALAFKNFNPNKHYIFPIPETELSGTKLVQNSEWK